MLSPRIPAGLYTQATLLPLNFTMFTLVFLVYFEKGFGKMEKAAIFGCAFIALFFTGSGKYSIDARLEKPNT
jgi:putative oxidoreductase